MLLSLGDSLTEQHAFKTDVCEFRTSVIKVRFLFSNFGISKSLANRNKESQKVGDI